jgi:ribose transport system substrate-binding protein
MKFSASLTGAAFLAIAAACAAAPARADDAALIASLPDQLKVLYDGTSDVLLPSAYDDFAPPATPWKWCHSESYQGNPWRVSVTNELRRLVDGAKAKGMVSEFEVSDSNGDTSRQISQIRAFIDKKCTVITSIAGSATGLNDAIEAAYKAGIPFITAAGSVTSPDAINVDSNYTRWGYDMMTAIADSLGGKGNILLVEGIAGHPIVVQERAGADAALKQFPGLKVVRTVNGNWTPNVTKTVVLQALATTPQKIDAVWTTGSESRVIAQAFEEARKPTPLITGSTSGDALGYWKLHPDRYRFEGHGVLPGWTAETLFRVAMRVLNGEQPKLNTLMMPIPVVAGADLGKWYSSCMTPDAVSIFPKPPTDPMPGELLNAYFKQPRILGFNYADTPDPCAGK